jgi:hypothetical protein
MSKRAPDIGPGLADLMSENVQRLRVEVELELVRVRAHPERVDVVLVLPGEPGLDEVRREDAALEEEVVVLFEGA